MHQFGQKTVYDTSRATSDSLSMVRCWIDRVGSHTCLAWAVPAMHPTNTAASGITDDGPGPGRSLGGVVHKVAEDADMNAMECETVRLQKRALKQLVNTRLVSRDLLLEDPNPRRMGIELARAVSARRSGKRRHRQSSVTLRSPLWRSTAQQIGQH